MARMYLSLIGLSLIWGLSFVFIKWLVVPAGVWGTVFLRCLAGAVILLPIFFVKRRKQKEKQPLPYWKLLVVGLTNAAIPWGMIALSETQINSNTASILNATTPIWTGLIGFLIFAVSLTSFQWIGIIVGFIGILVLMNFDISGLFSSNFVGVGTMIIATICYGFSSQFTKRQLSGTSIIAISTFQLLVGTVVGFIGMLLTEPFVISELFTTEVLLGIIGLGCFGSGIATLIFFYIISESSPEFASTVTYLVPATAMIWGFVLLGEPISYNLILGLMIIFVGVFLSSRKSKKQATALLKSAS